MYLKLKGGVGVACLVLNDHTVHDLSTDRNVYFASISKPRDLGIPDQGLYIPIDHTDRNGTFCVVRRAKQSRTADRVPTIRVPPHIHLVVPLV